MHSPARPSLPPTHATYEDVKGRLKAKYRILQRKSRNATNPHHVKETKVKVQQITQTDDDACRKCGERGHWANDPSCPKFWEPWPKTKGKGKGKGGGKGKGKGAKGAKGDWKGSKGKGEKGAGRGDHHSSDQVCYSFHNTGRCHYGKRTSSYRTASAPRSVIALTRQFSHCHGSSRTATATCDDTYGLRMQKKRKTSSRTGGAVLALLEQFSHC